MKLAVTGGLGFIGKHLLTYLQNSSISVDEVTVFERKVSLRQKEWIDQLELPVQLIQGDILALPMENLLSETDTLIHLAWSSTPSLTGSDLKREGELNLPPSKHVIQSCIQSRTKLVFLSSGGTVYGEAHYLPIDEDHPKKPISAYGKVKLAIEREILKANESGLDYLILRPSNCYGPDFDNSKGYGVLGHWIQCILNSQPLQIIGDANSVRDFIHVFDLVHLICELTEQSNHIINIGSGTSHTLHEIFEMVENIWPQPIQKVSVDARPYDVHSNYLNTDLLNSLIEYQSSRTIQDFLQKELRK